MKLSKKVLRVFHLIEQFPSCFHLTLYKQEMEMERLSPDSIKYYLEIIYTFIKHSSIRSAEDFGRQLVIKPAYYALHSKNLSAQTLLHYYKCLKRYIEFLKKTGIVDKNPMSDILPPKQDRPLPKALSESEVQKLLKYCLADHVYDSRSEYLRMRGYVIIYIFLNTGLRRQELLDLQWENIFNDKILVELGKGRKSRYIFINQKTSKLLQEWKEFMMQTFPKNSYVFCLNDGNQLTENALRLYLKRISKKVGFSVHAHLLRHTYCSMAILKGVSLYAIQLQMGHSSIVTTNRYMHMNNEALKQEIERKFHLIS